MRSASNAAIAYSHRRTRVKPLPPKRVSFIPARDTCLVDPSTQPRARPGLFSARNVGSVHGSGKRRALLRPALDAAIRLLGNDADDHRRDIWYARPPILSNGSRY